MWNDVIETQFFWTATEKEFEKLLYELVKAEREEDSAIYLLLLHYDHARKTLPFTRQEKAKILNRLSTLLEESRRHQRLLQEMVTKLEDQSREAKT